ncbi:MAG: DUF1731 domain-containing protein, partial [Planctomycetaceae bacterium]
LGKLLIRHNVFPMPAVVAKTIFGKMAKELFLGSTRVLPKRLEETGYEFQYPTLEGAFRHLLGR